MQTGTIKWFNATKGYGFIAPDQGDKDVFVHISALEKAGLSSLEEGQKVEFDTVPGRDGRTAADNLQLVVSDYRNSPPAWGRRSGAGSERNRLLSFPVRTP